MTYCKQITPTTPVFVDFGGEGQMPSNDLADTYSISYFAKELNGIQFALEHRYYGKSWPNTTTEDLQYLSSKQAIQDIATFVAAMKKQYNLTDTNKVILTGGSYTGFMSEMGRSQLSHVIDFSQAASGPNLAKTEFPQYYQHFDQQVQLLDQKYNLNCYDNMIKGISYLVNLTHDQNEDGSFNLSRWQQFTGMDSSLIPENLTWKDIGMLEGVIPGDLISTMQYYKMPGYNGSDDYKGDLQIVCQEFNDNLAQFSDQTIENCAKAYLQTYPDIITTDFSYQSTIDCFQDITNQLDCGDSRSWTWQTCTEFGYFQDITGNLTSIYGIYNNISLSYAYCYDAFFYKFYNETDNNTYPITEKLVNDYIDYTNSYYGARNQQRDNVFITAGTVDPWSELQLLSNRTWAENGQYLPSENTAMETLDERSHCTDMYLSWTVNDQVRKEQLDDMKQWLDLQ